MTTLRDATSGRFVSHLTDDERRENRTRSVATYNAKRRNGEAGAVTQSEWQLWYKYGLTTEQFNSILASQGGGCAICGVVLEQVRGKAEKHGSKFQVDHDHKTGAVRGILCFLCNSGLGKFRDDSELLEKAAKYLNREVGPDDHTS